MIVDSYNFSLCSVSVRVARGKRNFTLGVRNAAIAIISDASGYSLGSMININTQLPVCYVCSGGILSLLKLIGSQLRFYGCCLKGMRCSALT